jgi:CRP/FNR family cyclic AMP-dependent transcriptional regulator
MTMTAMKSNHVPMSNGDGTKLYPLLRRTGLSRFMNESQLKDLEPYCRAISRKAGTTLYRQGDPAETLYLVVRGSVELRARPPGRRVYRTVEVIGERCTVGDEALLGEATYFTSARVQETAQILALSVPEFERLSTGRSDIALALLRCSGSCLIQTVRRSAILTQAPADVALELLLRELSTDAREGTRPGSIRITHAQLAGLLHLSRETVSRMLGQMAAAGMVELSRGVIRLNSR